MDMCLSTSLCTQGYPEMAIGGCGGALLALFETPESPGFAVEDWGCFLFLDRWIGCDCATSTTALCGDTEGVSSEDFSSSRKDAVRSEELALSRGVTSLSSMFLRAPEEAEKEEEEVMSVPKKRTSWRYRRGSVPGKREPSKVEGNWRRRRVEA